MVAVPMWYDIDWICVPRCIDVIRFGVITGHKVRCRSAMLLEMNGRTSSSKRTRHIEIRYYYVANQVAKGWPWGRDFLTKPLQGKVFIKFWDLLMGAVWLYLGQIIFQFRFEIWRTVGNTGAPQECVGWDVHIVAITKLGERVAITKLGERVAITKLGEQVAITKLGEQVVGNTKLEWWSFVYLPP